MLGFKDQSGECIGLQSSDEQAKLVEVHVQGDNVSDRGSLIRRRRRFSVNPFQHSLIAVWSDCVTRPCGMTQIAFTSFRVQSTAQLVNTTIHFHYSECTLCHKDSGRRYAGWSQKLSYVGKRCSNQSRT